jgi:diketogulonate reductase-like aldo/keto reductase
MPAILNTRAFGSTGRQVPAVGQGSWRIEAGEAAAAIGAAIQGRRDQVYLVSKVLPSNASKRGTIKACDRSLANLNTDRLDCYLLHWRGSYPLGETIAVHCNRLPPHTAPRHGRRRLHSC